MGADKNQKLGTKSTKIGTKDTKRKALKKMKRTARSFSASFNTNQGFHST